MTKKKQTARERALAALAPETRTVTVGGMAFTVVPPSVEKYAKLQDVFGESGREEWLVHLIVAMTHDPATGELVFLPEDVPVLLADKDGAKVLELALAVQSLMSVEDAEKN